MTNRNTFPDKKADKYYMCEGGTETEIMYKHGFDFPHFAIFELLKNPKAVSKLKEMFEDYFSATSEFNMSALVGGLDYRASPDWGKKLGYSAQGLADINHQCIEFLREVAKPFSFMSRYPHMDICGGCCGTWVTHLREIARNVGPL